jgi:cold shock CspA family protein/CRISPR/Cas system CSM-associated protein Csm3 (group 7 of RAMP superfamily)
MSGQPFLNAFHFIPRQPTEHPVFAADHHLYAGLSGTISCTLTLEQPTVIGARRSGQQGNYQVLNQFLYGTRPAIPATSIKGLISSLAEAASLSAYRVLKDEKLTVRDGQNARVFPSTVHDYVPEALRPLSLSNERSISLAEQMFGYVIDSKKGNGSAFAGRVRPSLAVLSEAWRDRADDDLFITDGDYHYDGKQWVRLKEQSQPMKEWERKASGEKYRSATPNFYMKERSGASAAHIGKSQFATGGATKYEIQGQKAYLHHLLSDTADKQPWKTAAEAQADQTRDGPKGIAAERKTVVRPLKKGVAFIFTLSFDNLSEAMLDLLCFALLPSPGFRHKIGYGKPLGLGSVRIVPGELVLLDRQARYAHDDIFARPPNTATESAADRAARHSGWLEGKHPAAKNALLLIGERHDFDDLGKAEPANPPPVLWVPLTTGKFNQRGQVDAEKDSYEWFSKNDRVGAQRLTPIADRLPTLFSEAQRLPPPAARQNSQSPAAPVLPQPRQAAVDVRRAEQRVYGHMIKHDPDAQRGMIQPEKGGPLVPFSSAGLDRSLIREGQAVRFDIVNGANGTFQAINIRRG